MRSLLQLLAVMFFFSNFNVGFANLQKPNDLAEKTYINPSDLQLTQEGIFLKISPENYIRLSQLHHDSNGYYLRGRFSNYIAYCLICGYGYSNRAPVPCENCKLSGGFDYQYSDIWDRRE